MKFAARMIGMFAIAMGLLWIGQGTGLIDWPRSNFMIDRRPWAVAGAVVAAIGVFALVWGRSGRRR